MPASGIPWMYIKELPDFPKTLYRASIEHSLSLNRQYLESIQYICLRKFASCAAADLMQQDSDTVIPC